MLTDAFKERERALEDEFYYRVDQQLLENLRHHLATEERRKRIAAATGFRDMNLLDELVSIGVSAEALAAVSLAPLILVAWADGSADPQERAAVLQTARELHIEEDTPADHLLKHWLASKPDPSLFTTWKHYVRELCENMSSEGQQSLRDDVLARGKTIALASGGANGPGNLSPAEQRMLTKVRDALTC